MFWKQQQKNAFTEINRLSKGLSLHSSHSAVQKFITILNQLFPSFSQSLLSNLYEQSFRTSPEKWQKIYSLAIELLSPKSQIGLSLLANKDVKIEINNLTFSGQFESYMKQSQLIHSQRFKKQDFSLYKVPMLQCFFVCLGLCVATLKDQQRKVEWENVFYQNQFFFYITRNPILIIIKNWLSEIRPNPPLYNRIMFILQTIFLKDSIVHIKKKEKTHIKSAIMYAIYLISEWKVGIYHWQFLQCLSLHLQRKNNGSDIFNLWVKLNLSILMNATPLQAHIRRKLLLFSYQCPNFNLKYFDSMDGLLTQSFKSVDFRFFQSFLYRVQSLIRKNFWNCSPSFMQAVYIIIVITKSFGSNEYKFQMIKFLKNVIKAAPWNLKSQQAKSIVQRIETEFNGTKIIEFEQEEQEEIIFNQTSNNHNRSSRLTDSRQSIQSSHRKSLIVHQDVSEVNAWMKPLQSGQSALLFQLFKWVAGKIDRLRKLKPAEDKRSKSLYPNTNLRFLVNWKLFLLLVMFLAMITSYLVK